jgi:hypothetical protein
MADITVPLKPGSRPPYAPELEYFLRRSLVGSTTPAAKWIQAIVRAVLLLN